MGKNSLSTTGISLSQAQSISNLCNQRALDINTKISGCNNSEKSLKIDNAEYIETKGKKLPENVSELLKEKSSLHATQAFLMENIKSKDLIIRELQSKRFVAIDERPKSPAYESMEVIPTVGEEWGWEQLTTNEYYEFLEAEAFAAHFGQFIHKGGQLDRLRTELPHIKTLEWIEVKQGEKTPLNINVHHNQEELLKLHEELASVHRGYEQKVNYFKAKVKNLTTEENARIAKENGQKQAEVNANNNKLRADFDSLNKVWEDNQKTLAQNFEEKRQNDIKTAASLRIQVDPRFQSTIDTFLKNLE